MLPQYYLFPANAHTVQRGGIYLPNDKEGNASSIEVKVCMIDPDGFYYNYNNQTRFVNFNTMSGAIIRPQPKGYPMVLVRESTRNEVEGERILKVLKRKGYLWREDDPRNKLLKALFGNQN